VSERGLARAFAGFLLGATAMFAATYSTQAILPELSREFGVSPSRAGLTVSVVILAVATGGYLWGPLSDRIGRPRAIRLASLLLVPPTIAVALAPTFPVLLGCRLLQGLCMPGLLIVGAPYVYEAFVPVFGARAMGYYAASLIMGGLIGRLGVALATAVVGWRTAIGALAVFPLAAAVAMRTGLPEPPARPSRGGGLGRHVRDPRLLALSVGASALFFAFTGSFTFITYRLEDPPFSYANAVAGLVFALWLTGLLSPLSGRVADRRGWLRLVVAAVAVAAVGVLVTIPDDVVTIVLGLALVSGAFFSAYTGTQIGLGDVARFDRGAATAIFYSVYYTGGALGAYVPGLAYEAWGWNGVAAVALAALGVAAVCVSAAGAGGRRSAPVAPSASHGAGRSR
jgi:YNFM family putative membrane transporter